MSKHTRTSPSASEKGEKRVIRNLLLVQSVKLLQFKKKKEQTHQQKIMILINNSLDCSVKQSRSIGPVIIIELSSGDQVAADTSIYATPSAPTTTKVKPISSTA